MTTRTVAPPRGKMTLMAAQAVRPRYADRLGGNETAYAVMHVVDFASGRSLCNRGRLEMRARTMVPATSVPWGKRCRRGACNSMWLQIPDESGEPPVEPEMPRPRPRRVGPQTEVTSAQLVSMARISTPHRVHTPLGWKLELFCGHVVYRGVQYALKESASTRVRRRSVEDLRPAPKSARCDTCK